MSRFTEVATAVTYPFPTFVFGLIAFSVFIVLGLVTFSFRDVSNRHHEHKADDHKGHH